MLEDNSIDLGLFSEQTEKNWTTRYLIDEHPKVEYFLKVSGGNSDNVKIAQELQKIPAINMTYTINVEELKSKDYLILN